MAHNLVKMSLEISRLRKEAQRDQEALTPTVLRENKMTETIADLDQIEKTQQTQ